MSAWPSDIPLAEEALALLSRPKGRRPAPVEEFLDALPIAERTLAASDRSPKPLRHAWAVCLRLHWAWQHKPISLDHIDARGVQALMAQTDDALEALHRFERQPGATQPQLDAAKSLRGRLAKWAVTFTEFLLTPPATTLPRLPSPAADLRTQEYAARPAPSRGLVALALVSLSAAAGAWISVRSHAPLHAQPSFVGLMRLAASDSSPELIFRADGEPLSDDEQQSLMARASVEQRTLSVDPAGVAELLPPPFVMPVPRSAGPDAGADPLPDASGL